jgi:hypothetical protein
LEIERDLIEKPWDSARDCSFMSRVITVGENQSLLSSSFGRGISINASIAAGRDDSGYSLETSSRETGSPFFACFQASSSPPSSY